MSARLTKTLLARVATDANLRKESAAQAKELKKRRKEAAKAGKSISTGQRPGKKRKLKRKVKAKDERRTNFLEDAAKEIQRRDQSKTFHSLTHFCRLGPPPRAAYPGGVELLTPPTQSFENIFPRCICI